MSTKPTVLRQGLTIPAIPLTFLLAVALSSGCSTLIGNVKPVTEKSHQYELKAPNEEDRDWKQLASTGDTHEEDDGSGREVTQQSDVAWQSDRTGSIISLNSACRPSLEQDQRSLLDLSQQLFLGFSQIEYRQDRDTAVNGVRALESTVRGTMSGQSMIVQAVVLKKGTCLYDLMYVSRPEHAESQRPLFQRFVSSLRIRP